MTDLAEPDARFIVVYETEPEQQAGAANPFADEAREILEKVLRDIMETALHKHELWSEMEASIKALDLTMPHNAVRITTGSGKSDMSRQAIAAHYIPKAKPRKLPHRVLIAVPTHKLANEARIKMPAGITVAIWQGRYAIRLGTADEKMCLNPEAVKAAMEIGAAVEETACRKARRGKDPILCPFYDKCAYQAQKVEAPQSRRPVLPTKSCSRHPRSSAMAASA